MHLFPFKLLSTDFTKNVFGIFCLPVLRVVGLILRLMTDSCMRATGTGLLGVHS
jgi:hypothetical protein